MKLCSKCGHKNDVDLGQTSCFQCGAELPVESLPEEPKPPTQARPEDAKPTRRTSSGAQKRISHISIHQTSKVLAILYVAIGLIFIPIGVIFIIADQKIIGIIYVLMPFIYGIIGYPLVAVMCWLYNMIAKSAGGIEFTVEDIDHAA